MQGSLLWLWSPGSSDLCIWQCSEPRFAKNFSDAIVNSLCCSKFLLLCETLCCQCNGAPKGLAAQAVLENQRLFVQYATSYNNFSLFCSMQFTCLDCPNDSLINSLQETLVSERGNTDANERSSRASRHMLSVPYN